MSDLVPLFKGDAVGRGIKLLGRQRDVYKQPLFKRVKERDHAATNL
jgi:hypothetical protein